MIPPRARREPTTPSAPTAPRPQGEGARPAVDPQVAREQELTRNARVRIASGPSSGRRSRRRTRWRAAAAGPRRRQAPRSRVPWPGSTRCLEMLDYRLTLRACDRLGRSFLPAWGMFFATGSAHAQVSTDPPPGSPPGRVYELLQTPDVRMPLRAAGIRAATPPAPPSAPRTTGTSANAPGDPGGRQRRQRWWQRRLRFGRFGRRRGRLGLRSREGSDPRHGVILGRMAATRC